MIVLLSCVPLEMLMGRHERITQPTTKPTLQNKILLWNTVKKKLP